MVAGIELEKHATGDEMLNQHSKSQIFPNTKLNPPEKTRGHLLLRNVTFLHGMMSIWNHFRPC